MYSKSIKGYSYFSLFELNSENKNHTYFKFKNKYDYRFSKSEKLDFQESVLSQLNSNKDWLDTELIIIPETENLNFIDLVKATGKDFVVLKKQSIDSIKLFLNEQFMMKSEKEKLLKFIDSMQSLKIGLIAGNQRKRFIDCLFEDLTLSQEYNKKTSFFDDSVFSGYTFLAAQKKLNLIEHKNFILFDKNL